MYVQTHVHRRKKCAMMKPLHFQVWTTDFCTCLHIDINLNLQEYYMDALKGINIPIEAS